LEKPFFFIKFAIRRFLRHIIVCLFILKKRVPLIDYLFGQSVIQAYLNHMYMKLFIVSNRLPVKAKETSANTFLFERSEGGLATGLSSIETKYETHWVGWPGVNPKRKTAEKEISQELEAMNYHPVFLTNTQYNNYYEGYSNSTLWPLCHYFFSFSRQNIKYWDSYQEVNAKFCDKVLEVIDDDSMVWVQDYQLMLLPNMLRKKKPNIRIGYFHHIPFPSYELFRVLRERKDLLEGLLGADLVAFHTHDYMRHFISTVERTLHKEFSLNEIMIDNRVVHVESLPMGINYNLYHNAHRQKDVKKAIKIIRAQLGNGKIILSVDRLDYSKGILHRLIGFETFLSKHPECCGDVTLAMVVVPSRDKVEKYAEMKRKIDERISNINGKYAKIGWTPVVYFYHSFPFNELVAMYSLADIALVTPLRDGMNLVAKEYVATKYTGKGVLILSEMAGSATEMTDALIINPNNPDEIASAIYQALTMPEKEQKYRLSKMQENISTQTVNKWAADFMDEWLKTISKNKQLNDKYMSVAKMTNLKRQYIDAKKRLIMLDYDGTLMAFQRNPMDVAPTPQLINVLKKLCEDNKNMVVINSGRDKKTLETWLGSIPQLSLAAEHGASYKRKGEWVDTVDNIKWNEQIVKIMKAFTRKTPGAWVEKKNTALAWHYRNVDTWMGMLRSKQLMQALFPICSSENLQILNGNKVLEVKPNEYTKGTEVQRLLAAEDYDFMLAMGDDVTDESMFSSMPNTAVTIKVGAISDKASLCIRNQEDVIPLLSKLAEA
jgi:trehalose 6-phosphate synthase/phosphatase